MTAQEVVRWAREELEVDAKGAESLGGGLLNEVWRIDADPLLVLKIYSDKASENEAIELTPERGRFEAAALRLFEHDDLLSSTLAGITVPSLRYFDPYEARVVMTHFNHRCDIGVALQEGAVPESRVVELATWLGGVHRTTRHRVDLLQRFNNAGVQRTRLRVQYASVERVAHEAELDVDGDDVREAGRRALALGRSLLEPGDCLVMGDLWPPSVLVADTGIAVIDWEFCHYGRPLQDVAHFAAHLWLLADSAADRIARIRIRNALQAFVESYRRAAGWFDEDELAHADTHVGAEILMRTYGAFADPDLYTDEGARREAAERGIGAILGEWSPLRA